MSRLSSKRSELGEIDDIDFMTQDPRIESLLGHLEKLAQQHALFKTQADALAKKLPKDSPERANVEQLHEQLGTAVANACMQLEKMGVKKEEIMRIMASGNPSRPAPKIAPVVIAALLVLAAAGVFIYLNLR